MCHPVLCRQKKNSLIPCCNPYRAASVQEQKHWKTGVVPERRTECNRCPQDMQIAKVNKENRKKERHEKLKRNNAVPISITLADARNPAICKGNFFTLKSE